MTQNDTTLKIDFGNDVGFHAGSFWGNEYYHRLGNPTNIISNKLCALQRNAAKDIADILFLSFTQKFNWMQMVEDAKNKDTWANEIDIATHTDAYEVEQLRTVLWTQEPNYDHLQKCLHTIAKDILLGADNSLFSMNN